MSPNRETIVARINELERITINPDDGKIILEQISPSQQRILINILESIYKTDLEIHNNETIFNALLTDITNLTMQQTIAMLQHDYGEVKLSYNKNDPSDKDDEYKNDVKSFNENKSPLVLAKIPNKDGYKDTIYLEKDGRIGNGRSVWKYTIDASSNNKIVFEPTFMGLGLFGGSKKTRRARNLHKKSKKTRRARKTVKRGGRKSRK